MDSVLSNGEIEPTIEEPEQKSEHKIKKLHDNADVPELLDSVAVTPPDATSPEPQDSPEQNSQEPSDSPDQTSHEPSDLPTQNSQESLGSPDQNSQERSDSPDQTSQEPGDSPDQTSQEPGDSPGQTSQEPGESADQNGQVDSVQSREGSVTCLVNTSDQSLIHHANVLSTQQQTEMPSEQSEPTVTNGVHTNEASPLTSGNGEQSEDIVERTVPNDRNLEQFSEILLDSDEEIAQDAVVVPARRKSLKKVRFADQEDGRDRESSRSTTHSPPLRPSHSSSPEDVVNQRRVPISPSSPSQVMVVPQFSTDDLIAGVEFPCQYLGSTPIYLTGVAASKSSRMYQAQEAVKLIKDPDNVDRPTSAVNIKISTQAIIISDNLTNAEMMEHPLHTISYVADIDNVLVVMAHVIPAATEAIPQSPVTTPTENRSEPGAGYTPKMTCHVLDTENARNVAMVIGQAFSAAYKQYLRSNGISEEALEQAEYAHILNAQTVPQVDIDSFRDRNKTKKLTMAKHKGEMMGVMVMESGYGSAIPSCIIAQLNKAGAAMKSGLLNVGDHIISINGVNLVGMPKKACIDQLKKCRSQVVVKMVVCSCPPVVEVTIVRPDLKYQLGFSVQKGMITSLIRGSIGERSGIRVGHRIIEINGTSTVSMEHQNIVHLLSCTVGDLHLRTMPDLMYKLLTGQLLPDYN